MSRRVSRGDPHGPNTLHRYRQIHAARMAAFVEGGFVVHDGLAEEWINANTLVIVGRIECQHALFVDARKSLAAENLASGERQVQTVKYTYHAGVLRSQDRGIFQYDTYHIYRREGHADEHHKHVWDTETWQKQAPPQWIGRARWPHLSDVIRTPDEGFR